MKRKSTAPAPSSKRSKPTGDKEEYDEDQATDSVAVDVDALDSDDLQFDGDDSEGDDNELISALTEAFTDAKDNNDLLTQRLVGVQLGDACTRVRNFKEARSWYGKTAAILSKQREPVRANLVRVMAAVTYLKEDPDSPDSWKHVNDLKAAVESDAAASFYLASLTAMTLGSCDDAARHLDECLRYCAAARAVQLDDSLRFAPPFDDSEEDEPTIAQQICYFDVYRTQIEALIMHSRRFEALEFIINDALPVFSGKDANSTFVELNSTQLNSTQLNLPQFINLILSLSVCVCV
jgi:hypothetical protein